MERPRALRPLSPGLRWRLACAASVVAVLVLVLLLRGYYRRELYHLTGSAQWMWVSDDVADRRPVAAVFFLPLRLQDHPTAAVAKVCGDREYVLWINGQPVAAGRSRPGFRLDVVEVTDLMAAGRNLIAIEARSPTSVGAVLFALDLYPTREGRRAGDPSGRAVVVSGAHWAVSPGWRSDGEGGEPSDGVRPWVWGSPPDHPWSYPDPVRHGRPLVQAIIGEPLRLTERDFKEVSPGRWEAAVPRSVTGLLWLAPSPAWRPGHVSVRVRNSTEGGDPVPEVVVVPVEGQRRWLFPERVKGDVVEVVAPRPPRWAELVEAIPTRLK